MTTLFGNFLLALPISITRESLRPYAVAGLGWVHASANDIIGFNAVSNDFLGLALGGGAIGFVSDTAGLRFDLRYFKSVSSGDVSELPAEGSARSASGGRPSAWSFDDCSGGLAARIARSRITGACPGRHQRRRSSTAAAASP